MTDSVLSSDMQAQWPHFHLKTKVLRSHDETMVHPVFRWVKRTVKVIDQVQFEGIVVTQAGRSWEIPLQSTTDESKQTNSVTEVSTQSS